MRKLKFLILVSLITLPLLTIALNQNQNSFNPNMLAVCDSKPSSTKIIIDCYSNKIMTLPLNKITDELSKLEKDNLIKVRCHVLSHKIGELMAIKYSIQELKAQKVNFNLCSQGIMHGYLEGLGKSESTSKLAKAALELCGQLDASGCIHGAGHALADAKISISKAGKICAILTSKLALSNKNSNLRPFNYNVNCIGGYIMQDFQSNQLTYSNLSINSFTNICKLPNTDLNYGCNFAYYRIFSNQPNLNDGLINKLVNTKMQKDGDVIRLEHLNYFKKYCSNLPNLEQKECNKQLGMSFADVFNYDRKPIYTAPILEKFCKSTSNCYLGYFEILTSQLMTHSEEYFKKFCSTQICSKSYQETVANILVKGTAQSN